MYIVIKPPRGHKISWCFEVVVLEARDRLGGRICTEHFADGTAVADLISRIFQFLPENGGIYWRSIHIHGYLWMKPTIC